VTVSWRETLTNWTVFFGVIFLGGIVVERQLRRWLGKRAPGQEFPVTGLIGLAIGVMYGAVAGGLAGGLAGALIGYLVGAAGAFVSGMIALLSLIALTLLVLFDNYGGYVRF